jgi:hypothetical protein
MHHMTMDNDFYSLFSAYWWLLFPLGWAIFRMVRLSMEHLRAEKALDLIRDYADKGKEVPPELLKVLQQPDRRRGEPAFGFTTTGFILGAFAVAFLVFMVMKGIMEGNRDLTAGLAVVVVLFTGLSLSFLLAGHLSTKNKPLDPP